MFEKANSISRQKQGVGADSEMLIGSLDAMPARAKKRGAHALRAIEWGELTARLDAARDLRELIRRDSALSIDEGTASFGDAAATYFRELGDGERGVNPVALEARKGSLRILSERDGDAAAGDAREK